MTPQEYLNTVTSQSPTPMAAPNNVADMLVFLASQPVGSVQVDPPPEPNPPAVELMNTINLIVEGLQRLLQAKATYQSITVPLPPQTEKGIMSNETRGDILLNALAYSGETIQQFYDKKHKHGLHESKHHRHLDWSGRSIGIVVLLQHQLRT